MNSLWVSTRTGKWEKMLEESGNFVRPEKWDPCDRLWVIIGAVY